MIWLLLGGAFVVGVAKTSVGGLATLSVMLFALAMPAKESTGALLLVYLAGDVVATVRYRHSAQWRMLRQLIAWVLPGLVVGTWFLTLVDAVVLKRSIGAILAISVVLHLVVNRSRPAAGPTEHPGRSLAVTGVTGVAAGFTTMTANAGGPVMALYLLAKKVDKHAFVGTAAWYFFIVNLAKVPFSIGVGALTWDVAVVAAPLIPVVWFGCALGIRLLHLIGQRLFNALALASTVVGAIVLLVT